MKEERRCFRKVDVILARHCKQWGRESVRKNNERVIKTMGLTKAGIPYMTQR